MDSRRPPARKILALSVGANGAPLLPIVLLQQHVSMAGDEFVRLELQILVEDKYPAVAEPRVLSSSRWLLHEEQRWLDGSWGSASGDAES